MSAFSPPPLPSGWTEHTGPGGQPYYYHAASQQSTYIRPLPAFPILPPPPLQQPKQKKEKPLVKTPIPGTEWLRVKTTGGNTFYTHKGRKESLWVVPEEIKEAVEELERAEVHAAEQAKLQQKQQDEEEMYRIEREREVEVERVKAEVQGFVKRKKREEAEPLDEVVITKKARDEEEDGEGDEEEDGEEDEEDDESEDEWQKEAAQQLAAEAEEDKKRQEKARLGKEAEEASAKKAQEKQKFSMPDRIDLSLDEAKALFKVLLREKAINPLHPWDTSLPLFVSDPRYVLLPSVSARREAFDEYCRDRARELREQNVKKEKAEANPKEEFERLLREEVKSTRTAWPDFRRTWKKDRQFYGWGRDDREREKRFKDYLKELGEKKRVAAEKAEADFFVLLRESGIVRSGSAWKDIKRKLFDDPRYDAVGSSSLREELFNTFLKAHGSLSSNNKADSRGKDDSPRSSTPVDEEETEHRRQEKKERALREREEKVRVQRDRTEAEIGWSRLGLSKEEGEREFRTLLTDAIRDPQLTWDAVLPQLKSDPRFTNSPLPRDQQLHLFHSYMSQLRAKHLNNLHALFEAHTPSLATPFSKLPLGSLIKSLPATKLDLDDRSLENEFNRWQRERAYDARKVFDEMLAENAFVEFWGRFGKMGGEGIDGGVAAEDLGEDEGEGFGGKVDMKTLAKNVDLADIVKVLKNDKRFVMFEHIPEERNKWLRVTRLPARLPVPRRLKLILPSLGGSVMRLLCPLVLTLTALTSFAFAQDASDVPKVKHDYQSDVTRLRKIVINRGHRDVFLRELISNSNDALEKFRLTALTEKDIYDGVSPLNVTLKAERDAEGKGGRIIITDTGIGMTAEELIINLGTLAKSGTSEFLTKADSEDTTGSGNLIGAFGVGFYSSFLVADRVTVASVPPKSYKLPNPTQNIFSSSADEGSFEIYPDPRGNTLGHGTEITLQLKSDAMDYLIPSNLMKLINQHSSFSTAFPIYLWNEVEEEVPVEEVPTTESETLEDEDEAIVEEDKQPEATTPKKKKVIVGMWEHMNSQPPLWMRDPKTVTDEEYELLYQATFKDFQKPLAWSHFSADSGDGVSFRALIYVPSHLSDEFFRKPLDTSTKDVKLFVKHVFITSDLGEYGLPKWASWAKVIVDAEDLPLNVSRETLQSSAFLKQIRNIIIRRLIQLFGKISGEDPEKFDEISTRYNTVLKLGAAEDNKNREKLAALTRYTTNQRNGTSFDDYIENKKQGQRQIFFLADMGKSTEHLAGSVFVEKLHARGYEVLLLNEPLDEILTQSLRSWKGIPFQDVARAGLKFGDDSEEDVETMAALTEKFAPLLEWLKVEAGDNVRNVIVSDRLVTSPCAVVADSHGLTANAQKLMSATSKAVAKNDIMQELMKKQKVLEINHRSPLIEGLLRRVEQLNADDEAKDDDLEAQLREVASILIDGALVRSGFEVADSNLFLTRVDRVLRRSLGVSETAPTDGTVKPAPPVDSLLPEEIVEDDEEMFFNLPDEFKQNDQFKLEMEEIDEEGNPVEHDEL
ncbi:HSP90-domain-containing protein [Gyrodon lividus]|nr:HSP90-domain-containing protein [Gyrodon lividus]